MPLRELVQEAEQRNPTIAASVHAWQASTHVPAQASALPGPELTVQQFSVGSPRPFAGFSDSNFAYLGIGASQDLPYPGKRRLRADVAARDADAAHAQSDAVGRAVVEALKLAYVQLAYLQQTLPILERNDQLLTQVQQIADSRYRVGEGNQQDVLKAQLQHTKILQEIADHHQQEGMLQAQLKQLLNRTQDTPDILAEPLSPTPIPFSAADIRQRARDQNPDLAARSAMVDRERAQIALAHKEFKPDFAVQYMYQHTASTFRDYYTGTFSVRLPNRDRQRAALAEAEERRQRAAQEEQAERQRVLADAQQQYVAIQGSNERLTIYHDGLMPQSAATLQAAMAAYSSNRQDFETLLSSFLDVLNVEIAYWRELADHESALARLERLTGGAQP
ncbi:MAG TPA: TolC family protein [Vicinamibacterales bacterium]|nr:TolC family protein [Vicinamibacterales bacterium]